MDQPNIEMVEEVQEINAALANVPRETKHEFTEDYFNGQTKSAYQDYKTCKGIVRDHAKIVLDAVKKVGFKPRSSFDAGCAYGYIVAYMKDSGLDAYGSDISEYAIAQGQRMLGDHVFVAPLPGLEGATSYDLVTCSEVLEHIPFEDVIPALERLLGITAKGGVLVIMPNMSNEGSWLQPDAGDPTHISMVPRSWWIETLNALIESTPGAARHEKIEAILNNNSLACNMSWGICKSHPEGRFFAITKS